MPPSQPYPSSFPDATDIPHPLPRKNKTVYIILGVVGGLFALGITVILESHVI